MKWAAAGHALQLYSSPSSKPIARVMSKCKVDSPSMPIFIAILVGSSQMRRTLIDNASILLAQPAGGKSLMTGKGIAAKTAIRVTKMQYLPIISPSRFKIALERLLFKH